MLITLADARALVDALQERQRRNENWLYADGLLQEAATRNGPMKIMVVKLERASKAQGLI
jgi:hypothetical protein